MEFKFDKEGKIIDDATNLDVVTKNNDNITSTIDSVTSLTNNIVDAYNFKTKRFADDDYVNNLFNIIITKIVGDVLSRLGNINSLEFVNKDSIKEIIQHILTNNVTTVDAYYFYEELTEQQELNLKFFNTTKFSKNFKLIPFAQKKYKFIDINNTLYDSADKEAKVYINKLLKKHTFVIKSKAKLFIENLKSALQQLTLNINSISNSVALSNAKIIGINGYRENIRATEEEQLQVFSSIAKAIDNVLAGKNSILTLDAKDNVHDFNNNLGDITKILELQTNLINYLISFNSFLPISYFTGEFSSGQGNNNAGEQRAVEDGLKIFFDSYLQEFFYNLDNSIAYKPNYAETLRDNIPTVAMVENSTLLDKRKILENLGLPIQEEVKNKLIDGEVLADDNKEDLFINE